MKYINILYFVCMDLLVLLNLFHFTIIYVRESQSSDAIEHPNKNHNIYLDWTELVFSSVDFVFSGVSIKLTTCNSFENSVEC